MKERTLNTYLYNVLSITFVVVCATTSFALQAQYKSNAPFTALLRHADSSITAQPYTLFEYDEAFESYFKDKNIRKKGSGYKQYPRWRNYWSYFTKDGVIQSPKELYQAYQNKISSNRPVNSFADWSPLGPSSAEVINEKLPGIGRLNQIAVDPSDPNTWFAGAPAGGLWKSTDAGNSWINLFDHYPQIGVSGIAIDPEDTQIIYIATGDDDALESYSIGVMKSIDGGLTFNETGLNVNNVDRGTALNEIIIDPDNHNIIWVAGTQGLYRSTNAGQSFSRVINDEITDFRLKPANGQVIYALSNNTFYHSTNGGTTFSQNITNPNNILPRSYMRAVMAVSPANPEVLYILYAKSSDGSLEGLYQSVDSGLTFSKRTVTVREQKTGADGNPYTEIKSNFNIMESSQAWFDLAIAVDPENANTVYTGCLNLWKSIDGGNNFSKLNNWYNSNTAYTHADIHTLKFFNGALYATTDGGLYRSTDGGESFTDYSNNGIATGQFYRLSIGKNDASVMVGGTQDNAGFIRRDNNWYLYTGGDGMDYEIDPLNSNLSYGFTQNGNYLFISDSRGDNLALLEGPSNESGNWITPLTITQNGEVLAGYKSLYVLGSSGFTKRSETLADSNIDDLEAAPSDANIVWAAEGSILYLSEDAGRTFTNITSLLGPISDMSINSNNPKEVFVTISNRVDVALVNQPENPAVWRVNATNPSALVKQEITRDLPTDQVYLSIAHQSKDLKNSLYVGTNLGVYRSDDSMDGWELYGENLPNTAVSDIELSVEDAMIFVSTYGRGVFSSPILVEKAATDIAISGLTTPSSKIFLPGEANLSAVLTNKGSESLNEATVTLSFNTVDQSPQNFELSLASEQSITADLGVVPEPYTGIIIAKAIATTANDSWNENNVSSHKFIVNTEAHFESNYAVLDQETTLSSLLPYDPLYGTGSWEKAEVTQKFTTTDYSLAWITNASSNYPDMERSYLLSPYYDLSLLEKPALRFDMAFNLETNWDLVYIQYSTNHGLTWQVLGSKNSTPKWYNSDRTVNTAGNDCYNCVGAQWTGEDDVFAQMTTYQYDFSDNSAIDGIDLTQEKQLLFRFVFESDQSVNGKGIAIDNFQLIDLNYQPAGITLSGDQIIVSETGTSDTFTVVLDSHPTSDVVLSLTASDMSEATVSPSTLTFTNSSWSTEQVVKVTGVDDSIMDGTIASTVTVSVIKTISDDSYDSLADQTVAVNTLDDEQPLEIPSTAFTVLVTDGTCPQTETGIIEATLQDAAPAGSYTATLQTLGSVVGLSQALTPNAQFSELAAGIYTLCITTDQSSSFKRCYTIEVKEPQGLEVQSFVNSQTKQLTLNLSGSDTYTILFNGKTITTTLQQVILDLDRIENSIQVKGLSECQGIFEETLVLSNEIFIYPNPVNDGTINLYLGNTEAAKVTVRLHHRSGNLIFEKTQPLFDKKTQLSVKGLNPGLYFLSIVDTTTKVSTTHKLIIR